MNISGCWSYLVEIYCRIEVDSETECVLRNGRKRMLLYTCVSGCSISREQIPTKPFWSLQKDDVEDKLYKTFKKVGRYLAGNLSA